MFLLPRYLLTYPLKHPCAHTPSTQNELTMYAYVFIYGLTIVSSISQKLDALREHIEAGKVRPVLDPTRPFSLETVCDMLAVQASHRVKGKLRLVSAIGK